MKKLPTKNNALHALSPFLPQSHPPRLTLTSLPTPTAVPHANTDQYQINPPTLLCLLSLLTNFRSISPINYPNIYKVQFPFLSFEKFSSNWKDFGSNQINWSCGLLDRRNRRLQGFGVKWKGWLFLVQGVVSGCLISTFVVCLGSLLSSWVFPDVGVLLLWRCCAPTNLYLITYKVCLLLLRGYSPLRELCWPLIAVIIYYDLCWVLIAFIIYYLVLYKFHRLLDFCLSKIDLSNFKWFEYRLLSEQSRMWLRWVIRVIIGIGCRTFLLNIFYNIDGYLHILFCNQHFNLNPLWGFPPLACFTGMLITNGYGNYVYLGEDFLSNKFSQLFILTGFVVYCPVSLRFAMSGLPMDSGHNHRGEGTSVMTLHHISSFLVHHHHYLFVNITPDMVCYVQQRLLYLQVTYCLPVRLLLAHRKADGFLSAFVWLVCLLFNTWLVFVYYHIGLYALPQHYTITLTFGLVWLSFWFNCMNNTQFIPILGSFNLMWLHPCMSHSLLTYQNLTHEFIISHINGTPNCLPTTHSHTFCIFLSCDCRIPLHSASSPKILLPDQLHTLLSSLYGSRFFAGLLSHVHNMTHLGFTCLQLQLTTYRLTIPNNITIYSGLMPLLLCISGGFSSLCQQLQLPLCLSPLQSVWVGLSTLLVYCPVIMIYQLLRWSLLFIFACTHFSFNYLHTMAFLVLSVWLAFLRCILYKSRCFTKSYYQVIL